MLPSSFTLSKIQCLQNEGTARGAVRWGPLWIGRMGSHFSVSSFRALGWQQREVHKNSKNLGKLSISALSFWDWSQGSGTRTQVQTHQNEEQDPGEYLMSLQDRQDLGFAVSFPRAPNRKGEKRDWRRKMGDGAEEKQATSIHSCGVSVFLGLQRSEWF